MAIFGVKWWVGFSYLLCHVGRFCVQTMTPATMKNMGWNCGGFVAVSVAWRVSAGYVAGVMFKRGLSDTN